MVFHLAWIAWPYLVYPRLTRLGEATATYAVVNLTLRLLIWVAPVLLFLHYVDRVNPLVYLKLTKRVGRGLAVAAGLTAVNLLGSIARFGVPHLTLERVTWNSVLGTSLLIGFIEEIPYRGFMLQKFAERLPFWQATLVTSLLFVAIHVPGWLALRMINVELPITIFIFAVVMAIALKFARSLWAPILTHSANDFLSFVVFRR